LKTCSVRRLFVAGGLIAACTALSATAVATPIVAVPATSLNPPQPLGTTITITASATDTDPGVISYRFEIGAVSSANLGMVRDFSVDPTFVFTPTEYGGNYQFVVFARNIRTGKTGTNLLSSFTFTSLVTGATPVVTPTANPLVALFSSPPCSTGGLYMRVSILRSGAASPSYTNWKPCVARQNLNFVVAGMRATSLYSLSSQTWNGTTITSGTVLRFTTGTPTVTFPEISVTTPFTSEDSSDERFMLMAFAAGFPMAVDLTASPIWYYLDPSGVTPLVTRPVYGGDILMLAYGANSAGTTTNVQQILREIDLGGNIIRETNATRVSEQLAVMSGIASSCQIGGTDCLGGAFSHEAVQLPNGHTLTMVDEEKMFTDGTQGSSAANPVDIIGDIIVDLDTNWQVAWYWRSFDHLDPNRAAILSETCAPGQPGCPPVLLTAGLAQDWLHGNALYYTSTDGSILYSMRHQDWIVKIDYGNGTGTNNILWTLGLGGDFTMNSTDPYPWFSHQHDPGFVQNGTTVMAMFDNGNTRVAPPPLGLGSGDSRGYVLNVDQTNMVVTPTLLADLGYFSLALGTAELLSNGDYHFEAGDGPTVPPFSDAIEVFPNATLGFTTMTSSYPCYRNFRMASLYIPPDKD
jgi:arylsulfate sulfotransferase